MFPRNYIDRFVPASYLSESKDCRFKGKPLTGEEAKRLYLEEVSKEKSRISANCSRKIQSGTKNTDLPSNEYTDRDLFNAVQNDNIDFITSIFRRFPDKVNTVDEFDWSLLMIACQAGSINTVKELLKLGADTSIRDKAGNSAQSLVIKNKNVALADIFLNSREEKITNISKKVKKIAYKCAICDNKIYPDRTEHLSSTIHNINASKKVKVAACYKIPVNNRGYQIMLKGGWDRDRGLGPDGSGKMYPIKTVQKIDRKGLGLERSKLHKTEDLAANYNKNRKALESENHRSRRIEINFRREFY